MSDFQDYDGEVVPLSADNQDISDLINRIRGVESGGNANAVSSQGAKGSMQIMPGTFKQYALDGESFDNDADRTAAATRKILDDYQYFGGDKAKTAAAYIGGRGAIRKDGSIRDDVTDAYGTSPASYIGKVFGTQDFVPYDGDIIPLSKAGAGRGMVNPKTEDIQKAIAADQKPEQGLWDKVGDTLNSVRDFARSIGTSDYDDTYDNRRSVNPMEAAGRAVTSGSANIAKQALLVSAGAPVLFDKAFGTNTADYVFSNIAKVDDIIRRNDIKPEEKQSTISKVSTAVSNMLPDLALMVATSGESALTKAGTSLVPEAVSSGKIILQALTNGMDFAKPVIVKAFSNSYEKSLNEGKSQSDAMNDALIDSAKTWATLSIPISMVGAPAQRMATGFGMGALQSEAERGAHNVMHPDQQIPYDPDNMVVGGVTNAILARTMGHDYPTFKAPNRSEMGYGYKTPIADSIQKAYNSPERSEYGSQRPENADVLRPVEKTPEQKTADIQSARNVDEAITAAKNLPTVQVPEGEAATQMFGVRPLREVTQEPRTETPVAEKPAVEPPKPDIESRRVSLEDLDVGLRKQGIYPPAVLDRARLDAEVRHDDLLDRQAYSDEALRRIATAPDAGPELTNAAIRALRARGEELTPAEVKTLEVKPLEQKPLEPVQGVIQPGSQLDVLHRALAEDFERLYQQDIKNDIKRRLGMEPEQADQPTSSPFKSFLREYGIQPSLAADITGERGLRANNVLPRTFRKDGLNLDALVEKAVERGFMHADEVHSDADNGGTNRLMEMIKAEIRGNRQLPVDRMQENAQAQHDRVQRMELEHEADRLGLQYPTGLESAKLASMVARVHRRLEEARAPAGSTKEQRIIRAAQEAIARVERKRAQLEAKDAEFDAMRVKMQDDLLEILLDADGNLSIVKRSDIEAERIWNEHRNNTADTRAVEDSQGTGKPDTEGTQAGTRLVGEERGTTQHRSDARTGEGEEGLTSPTRDDVLADQERRSNADALDRQDQIKRESEAGAGSFKLTAEDGRQDTTGMLFSRGRSENLRPTERIAPVSRHPGETPLYEAMRQLSRNKDAFQLRDSEAHDLGQIAAEMQSGLKEYSNRFTSSKGTLLVRGVRKPTLTLEAKDANGVVRPFMHIVDYDTQRPYIHIGNEHFATDTNGAYAYQIGLAWAHNNGKTMRPDPAGITPINRLRRTEAMIASALHTGTTAHMEPHPDQYIGLTRMAQERGIEHDATSWNDNPDAAHELQTLRDKLWKSGDDPATIATNVNNLIKASLRLTELRFPQAQRYGSIDGRVRESKVDGDFLVDHPEASHPIDAATLSDRVSGSFDRGVGNSTLRRYALARTVERHLGREGMFDAKNDGMGNVRSVQALRAIRSALGDVPVSENGSFRKALYSRTRVPGEGLDENSGVTTRADLESHIRSSLEHTPSSVEAVRSAIKSLTGIVSKDKLGHIVATTSDRIKDTWEPLLGKSVNIESEGDAGKAQAFYDKATNTIFLIADHIRKGDEQAVLAHELMHKWGRQVLGEEGWNRLHSTISGWEKAETHTQEYAVWKYASDKVEAAGKELSTEELFPYAVEGAMKMGIEPSMAAPKGSVARWLESVRQSLKMAWSKITGNPESFKAQDLVDMAFAISRMENPADRESIAGAIERKKDDVSPIGFYSALSRGVDAIKTTAAPAAGWKDAIKGLVNKGLAKSDEVEWSGVNEWLDMQGGKVTKQQVMDFLRGNGVQVQEVTLGDNMERRGAIEDRLDELRGQDNWTKQEKAEFEALRDELAGMAGATKYGSYTLPGGTNYREVLLTFPGEYSVGATKIAALRAREVTQKMRFAETDEEYELLRKERAGLAEKSKGGLVYKSSHWDQPNVLAHIRVNDRTDADGKRVLFVEEVQSDWGQQGKKEGFAGTMEGAKAFYGISDADWNAMSQADRQSYVDEMTGRTAGVKGGVPTAPFVTKTDAWLNLALKRIIKMAVDEGYDKVAFVNGEQSADRYDLSKQVEHIDYVKSAPDRWNIAVVTKSGDDITRDAQTADQLEDLVGKEVAQKIVGGEGQKGVGGTTLRGLDLKVGGEGMKAFYDQIVPNAVKKMVGKLGGEVGGFSTGESTVNEIDDFLASVGRVQTNAPSAKPNLAFTITDAMREKVAGGLPLFSRTNENLEPSKSQISRLIESAINHTSQAIDKAGNFGGKGSAYELLAPMSAGTQKARAVAQEWINNNRVAQYEWQTIDNIITKKFSPAQRRKMYDAGDEENDLRREGIVDPTRGLGRLNPEERNVMEALHRYSKELWQRALDVGMVEGKGVDFWTPRQMAMIDENGMFVRPPGESMGGAKDARNFTATGGGSSKNRKYETSAETEAAMNAMGGTLVRDIRTMPLAMYRFERGIAGRELINQIKDLGLAVGKEFVIGEQRDGYFTLDHPAFTTTTFKEVPIRLTEYFDRKLMDGLSQLAENLGVEHDRKMALKGGALGLAYRNKPLVETKYFTPEQVLTHEIGHQLDYKYGLSEQLVKRGETAKELRALADLRFEGNEDSVSDYYKAYVRKASEKIANMVHAYVHNPERFREVAPETFKWFDNFVEKTRGLEVLKELGPSLTIGSRKVEGVAKVPETKKLYISSEFRGPLNAILTHDWAGKGAYNGYMLIKSKAMSAIMYSPLIHNQVILGRALAYGGIKTPMLYFSGHAAKKDGGFMKKMIAGGMVPIGNRANMLDVGDIANMETHKEGTWLDPNESWIGLGAKAVGNKLHDGLGDKLKAGLDYVGDVWHNKLLWERVGDLQAGIAQDVYTKLRSKGLDENAAVTVAAHIANRYAGAIGKESMSEAAHVIANLTMFSKSFNAGNVGTVKDAFYGLPAGLKAQLAEHSDVASAVKALDFAKNKARIGLVRDLVYAIVITSLVQDWVKRDKDKSFSENVSEGLDGYEKRAAEWWANLKDNPLKASSYDPYRFSSTWGNEPDKKDRVDFGEQPGLLRHEYMRLPTGKVIEDILGWIMHPGETFSKKESPLLRAAVGVATGEKDKYGTPIVPESAGTLEKIARVAKFIVGTHMPLDQIQTLRDIAGGHGTELDKDKTIGNLTGFTFGQGHPQGPEGAVIAKTDERVRNDKKAYMEEVRHAVKIGDYDAAYETLENVGLTAKEIKAIINAIENPKPVSKQQRTKFNRHANDSERQALDDLN